MINFCVSSFMFYTFGKKNSILFFEYWELDLGPYSWQAGTVPLSYITFRYKYFVQFVHLISSTLPF